jgi:multidrug efflux system membrane fusion protein
LLPQVYSKQSAGQQLTAEAWNRDWSKKLAAGKLSTIDNQIDQTTGTVRMRADFDNSDSALFPNQFVNVKLLVQEKTGVVLLNSAAVQLAGTRTYVWVVNPDSTVTVRDIVKGTDEGGATQIVSGLQPGDEVVMTGVDKLQDGQKVNAQVQGEAGGGSNANANGKSGGSGKNAGGKKGGGKKQ